jgi:hypothetical protein
MFRQTCENNFTWQNEQTTFMNPSLNSRLARIQSRLLGAGAIALGLSFLGLAQNARQFFFSYLFACVFWLGLSLGCLLVTMIHHLTGGRWGYPTRRFLEAGFMAVPMMALLFIPIFLGLHALYPWAQPALVANDPVLQQRQGYQNGLGFTIRTLAFFALVSALAWRLRILSLEQDATTDATPTRKARCYSGPGLVLCSLIATFVYIDWIMSLEQRWYSTMFAVIMLIGTILLAYAFSVIMITVFKSHDELAAVVSRTHCHHLGNLLLTFVLFWTYISFGQFLVVYSGDLPQEIGWYLHRIAGGWRWVIGLLALFHFFLPFFLLLFRATKTHLWPLACLAVLIFVMHLVNAYWLVMPALHQKGIALAWLDITAPIGVGCFWLSFFLSRLRAAPLLPKNDPGMQFAFVYQHGH